VHAIFSVCLRVQPNFAAMALVALREMGCVAGSVGDAWALDLVVRQFNTCLSESVAAKCAAVGADTMLEYKRLCLRLLSFNGGAFVSDPAAAAAGEAASVNAAFAARGGSSNNENPTFGGPGQGRRGTRDSDTTEFVAGGRTRTTSGGGIGIGSATMGPARSSSSGVGISGAPGPARSNSGGVTGSGKVDDDSVGATGSSMVLAALAAVRLAASSVTTGRVGASAATATVLTADDVSDTVVLVASSMARYGSEFAEKKLHSCCLIAAMDLVDLALAAWDVCAEVETRLLAVLTKFVHTMVTATPPPPLDDLVGMVAALVKLAATYTADKDIAAAAGIVEALAQLPRDVVHAAAVLISGSDKRTYWEVTNRGTNVFFVDVLVRKAVATVIVQVDEAISAASQGDDNDDQGGGGGADNDDPRADSDSNRGSDADTPATKAYARRGGAAVPGDKTFLDGTDDSTRRSDPRGRGNSDANFDDGHQHGEDSDDSSCGPSPSLVAMPPIQSRMPVVQSVLIGNKELRGTVAFSPAGERSDVPSIFGTRERTASSTRAITAADPPAPPGIYAFTPGGEV
jgi:hypothetical protein